MRLIGLSGTVVALGAALAIAAPVGFHTAEAKTRSTSHSSVASASKGSRVQAATTRGGRHGAVRMARWGGGGGLQCVPFARENTGIELSGNANTWWANAEGTYERGARPEVGSVLSFRANGRMRMGHVAVVSNLIDGRNIEIDHANWAGPGGMRGGVSRNIRVVDVSENNDWTAIRVSLGRNGEFGSVYPTYGFIYDRPDRGTMVANLTAPSPVPALNAPPRDLRPASERYAAQEPVEVAEAEDDPQPRVRRVSHRVRGAAPVAKSAAVTKASATKGKAVVAHGRSRHRT
jgi:surface antigen